MKRKVLSLLLVLLMVLSLLPTTALAGTGFDTVFKVIGYNGATYGISGDSYIEANYTGWSNDIANKITDWRDDYNTVEVILQQDYNGNLDFNHEVVTLDLNGNTLGGSAVEAENVTVTDSKTGGKLSAIGTYLSVKNGLVGKECTIAEGTSTVTVTKTNVDPYEVSYYNGYKAGETVGPATTFLETVYVVPGQYIYLRGSDDITYQKDINGNILAEFNGWTTGGSTAKAGAKFYPSENTIFTVSWTPYYAVTYNVYSPVNGIFYGTKTDYVKKGTDTTLLSADLYTALYPDYKLTGWLSSVDAKSYKPGKTDYTVNQDVTFTANFQKIENCTIAYYASADVLNTPIVTVTAKTGDEITLNGADTLQHPGTTTGNEEYVFDGWVLVGTDTKYDAKAKYIVSGDAQFAATWKKVEKYTVKYYDGSTDTGGSEITAMRTTVAPGTIKLSPADTISMEGYTFVGWLDKGTDTVYDAGEDYTVTANASLYAYWAKDDDVVNVIYSIDGSTVEAKVQAAVNSKIKLRGSTGYTKKDYTFDGWTCSLDNDVYQPGETYKVTGAVTFTANWKESKNCKITYYMLKDDVSSIIKEMSDEVVPGTDVTVSDATGITREEYTFGGWVDRKTERLYQPGWVIDDVDEDLNLYAYWIPNAKAVKVYYYDLISGTAPNSNMTTTAEVGTTITLSNADGLEKDGYTFGGWLDKTTSTLYSAGATNYPVAADADAVALYAKWVPNASKIAISYWLDSKANLPLNGNANYSLSGYLYVTNGEHITLYDATGLSAMDGHKDDTFLGWRCSENNKVYDPEYDYEVNTTSGNIKFVGYWKSDEEATVSKYTVKYFADQDAYDAAVKAADGGEVKGFGESQVVSGDDTTMLDPATVTNLTTEKSDSRFLGWYTSEDKVVLHQAGESYTVTKAVNFIGKWTKNETYTLSYYKSLEDYNKNKNAWEFQTVVEAGQATTIANPAIYVLTKTGYTFTDWKCLTDEQTYNATEPITPSKNMIFVGQWTSDTPYTVHYDLQSGTYKISYTAGNVTVESSIKDSNHAEGDLVKIFSIAPTKEGYTFVGWETNFDNKTYKADGTAEGGYKNFEMPAQDVTLTAVWKQNTPYTVTYSLDGGSVNDYVDTVKYDAGDRVTITGQVPTKTGYVFTGWTSSDTSDNNVYSVNGSIEGTYSYFTMPSENVVLTANWAKTYTVTYDFDGGQYVSGNTKLDGFETKTYAVGETVTITLGVPTKTGYVFLGWTSSDTSDSKLYNPDTNVEDTYRTFTMPAENVTLKAKWLTKYTLSYDFNGGWYKNSSTNTRVYGLPDEYHVDGDVIEIPSATFDDFVELSGQRFLGWRNSADDEIYTYGTAKDFFFIKSDVELKATWSKEYTVVYNLNVPGDAKDAWGNAYGGVAPKSEFVIDGQKLTKPTNPGDYVIGDVKGVNTTYHFAGWEINDTGKTWNFADKFDSSYVDEVTGVLALTAKWSTEKYYSVVFKDKLTEAKDEAAMFIYYNGNVLSEYNGSDLRIENISENALIARDVYDEGENQYPAFQRVDYTLGDSDQTVVGDWYMQNNTDGPKVVYDVTKTLAENNVAQYADANGVITLYANWNYNYPKKSSGYQIEINDTTLENATYGEAYSDYIVAETVPGVIPGEIQKRIYRNFYLSNAKGEVYNATDISTLPDGLYLNKLTGEIYGVPKETGTFSFYVKMEDDGTEYKRTDGNQIAAVTKITITIDELPLTVDRKAGDTYTYDKTYGDVDAKAQSLDDYLTGTTYASGNLNVTLDNTELAKNTAKTISTGVDVTLTTSDSDQTVKLAYDYNGTTTTRSKNANTFNPANEATLKYADADKNASTVFAGFADVVTLPVVRTVGEDAGSYKLYLDKNDVTYTYGAAKADASVYDLTVPAALASKTVDKNTAPKYVFTINPVELTLTLTNKTDYHKTYGDNDPVYPTNDLTTVETNNVGNKSVEKSATTALTIKYPYGFTDTLSVVPTRGAGEDAGWYTLSLNDAGVTTTATDKDIAGSKTGAAVKDNYELNITYTGNQFAIWKRALTFTPAPTQYAYGNLKSDDTLAGTFDNLANNPAIGVVDKAVSTITGTNSTAGYLNIGTYKYNNAENTNKINLINLAVTNSKWVKDASNNATVKADTSGNYTFEVASNVDIKELKGTLSATGKTVSVKSGTVPTQANIEALATFNGAVVDGETKAVVPSKVTYTADLDGNGSCVNTPNDVTTNETFTGATVSEAAAKFVNYFTANNKTLTADLKVQVTYEISATDAVNLGTETNTVANGLLDVYTVSSGGSSGGGGGGGGSSSYKVTVDDATHGDASSDHTSAASGTKVTVTVDPDKGYTVDTVTVKNSKNKEVELTKKSDTEYTFIMPSGNVTVSATFAEDDDMSNYFVDVNKGDYDYDAVFWAIRQGITEGTDATHFSPEWTCTRGQIVTFLWRAAGSPEPKTTDNPFIDVASSSYYAKAVQWASENGIAKGTTTTTFEPNLTCTRSQCVAFIARALGAKDATGSVSFTDVPSGAWYEGYVSWAVKNGITEGIGGGLFGPDQNCTRGQIVTFLYRAYNN